MGKDTVAMSDDLSLTSRIHILGENHSCKLPHDIYMYAIAHILIATCLPTTTQIHAKFLF